MMPLAEINAALPPWPNHGRRLVAGLALAAGLLCSPPDALASALIVLALAVIGIVDWRLRRIPDLMLILLVCGAMVRLAPEPESAGARLVVAGLAAALLLSLRTIISTRVGRSALGLGDVKLAAIAALLIGPEFYAWYLVVAAGAGLVHALAMGAPRQAALPFGTWLSLGALLFLCAGAG